MHNTIKTSWDEIAGAVRKLNRPLFDVIDSSNELKSQDLLLYKYRYGETVGDASYFYPPKPSTSKQTTIPFCMILEKSFEMPITIGKRSIPWKIYKPGDIFPYARFLERNEDYEPIHDLSLFAGSKSIFLLINKIADKKWHNLLCKKFNINSPPPKEFSDHFDLMKALCDSSSIDWRAILLVFPESFFEIASKNHDFKEMIYKRSLKEKLFKSNIYAYEALLDSLFRNDEYVTSEFVAKCIRNLLYIGCGDRPAHVPTENEMYAPIKFLTEAYINGFRSRSAPTFITSDFMDPFFNKNLFYFSLNNLFYLAKPEKLSSQAKVIREIVSGFEYIRKEIINSHFSEKSIFYKNARKLNLTQVIKTDDKYKETLHLDQKLLMISKNTGLPIPENSTFTSGCITLSYEHD